MRFDLCAPCKECPFRRDVAPYLSSERREQIAGYILRDDLTFACHKTTRPGGRPAGEEQMCAGGLAIHLACGEPNWRLRFAEQLGLWSRERMRGVDLVYASAAEMVSARPFWEKVEEAR